MNTILFKLTLLVILVIINPMVCAKEVSFAQEQLLSDQIAATGTIAFGNVQSADMDGDGDKDIVISQYGADDEISWLENDGGDFNDFPKHIVSTSTSSVKKLQLIDLDQDGDIDIVGVDDLADELFWFENDGTGITWTVNTIQSGITADGACNFGIADIDSDGDLDIALAACNTNVLYWYENTGGAMTWIQNDTGIVPAGNVYSLAMGDFDLNGSVDIVYGTVSGSPHVEIVSNLNGDGSSWSASPVVTSFLGTVIDIQAHDLDLDGITEIYYHANNGSLYQITYDNFSSSWLSPSIITSSAKGKTSFADIDNDGDLDILVGSSITLAWIENTDSMGGVWTERILLESLPVAITSVHAVDIDTDGDLEIVVAKNEDGFVYAYENLLFHSMPQYDVAAVIDSSHTAAYHVVTGLLNGDQYPDIISANKSNTGMEIFFYAGDGTGSYSLSEIILNVASTIDYSITAIALGDIDNDGDLDIVFAADGSDSIYIIENQMDAGPFAAAKSMGEESLLGANWSSATNIASGVGRSPEIQLTDINADGNLDIVYLAQVNGTVKWLDNDGSWTVVDIGLVSNQTSLKVGDLNGDGTIDVITGGTSSGGSRLWTNDNGDGLAWTPIIIDALIVPRQIAIADLDNDGDLDVVHGRSSISNIEWLENNGDATFWTRHDTMISTGFTPFEIVVKDYDNNGQLDILVQDVSGNISLLENNDIATDSWSLSTLTTGLNNPHSLVTLDFDFDGDTDIVSKGSSSSEIIAIENIGGQYEVSFANAAALSHEDSETIEMVS